MSNDAYHPSMMEEALDGMRRKEIADLQADLAAEKEISAAVTFDREQLRSEAERQRECIRSLTEQNASLIWERDGHGKSNVPDIFVQNAALTGENMVLSAELAACKRERDALRQGIKPVVIWLRNGCDPVEASKELLLLLENGK